MASQEFKRKCVLRANQLILEKERLVKQSSRQDPTFWRNEASQDFKRKHVLRANPLNLEQEHLAQQNLRQNNADKDKSYYKACKQSKRKSYTFLQHEQSIKKKEKYKASI